MNTLHRWVLCILGLLMAHGAWAQPAFRIVSDGNTKYSEMLGRGWELPGFDDQAWSAAIAAPECAPPVACVTDDECMPLGQVCRSGYCTTVDAPQPLPIWGSRPDAEFLGFRRTFDVAADGLAQLGMTFDGCGDVWMNGQYLGGGCEYLVFDRMPVGGGPNVLAFQVSPFGGLCHAVHFELIAQELPPPPPHDDQATPREIILDGNLWYGDGFDALGATRAPDEPAACVDWGPTVWYSFTPADDLVLSLNAGGDLTAAVAVFDEAGTLVGCDLYATSVAVEAGRTYAIQITGYPDGFGYLQVVAQGIRPVVNDEIEGAILVDTLPFRSELDFRAATRAPDDPAPLCWWAGYDLETVWYRIDGGPSGKRVILDGRQSTSAFTATHFSGEPGALVALGCHVVYPPFEEIFIDVPPDATYWLMVKRDNDWYGYGMVLDFYEAFQITQLVPTGGTVNNRTGMATATGTVTCNQADASVTVSGSMRQKINRTTYATGTFGARLICGPEPVAWALPVANDRPFAPGVVSVEVVADGCTAVTGCDSAAASGTARLRR